MCARITIGKEVDRQCCVTVCNSVKRQQFSAFCLQELEINLKKKKGVEFNLDEQTL